MPAIGKSVVYLELVFVHFVTMNKNAVQEGDGVIRKAKAKMNVKAKMRVSRWTGQDSMKQSRARSSEVSYIEESMMTERNASRRTNRTKRNESQRNEKKG